MDNFKAIYKILLALERSMDLSVFVSIKPVESLEKHIKASRIDFERLFANFYQQLQEFSQAGLIAL